MFNSKTFVPVGNLYGQVRKRHPWADAKIVKVLQLNSCLSSSILLNVTATMGFYLFWSFLQEVTDEKLHGILGERTAADDKKPLKKKKEKPVNVDVGYVNRI